MWHQGLLLLLTSALVAEVSGASLTHQQPNDLSNLLLALQQPHTSDLTDIRYLLWTRSNSKDDEYYRLLPGDLANLKASPLVPSLPTYVMYHGFNDKGLTGWITQAKTELLRLYDCNVLSVDWQLLVPSPWYSTAVENAYRTANHTASLLDWMAAEVGLTPAQLHITGHSLGAHAAGLTAKHMTAGTVSRITGLDPAGPLFYTKPPEQRIDKSDALFVDILHTNSGPFIEGCAGLFKPLGHVDFYPNGGMHQPGCLAPQRNNRTNIEDLIKGCSHARATEIWVESIAALPPTLAFTSWPCSDWDSYFTGECPTCGQGCLDMGYHVQRNLQGSYFLRTNPVSPYALGAIQ